MDKSIKSFTVLLVSICIVQGVSSVPQNSVRRQKVDQSKSQQNCTDYLEKIDGFTGKVTYSYMENPYPTSSSQLQASCPIIQENLKLLRAYSKCLSPFGRRVISTFAQGRAKHSKRICASMTDPKTIEFYKSNQCIKEANKIPALAKLDMEFGAIYQYLTLNKSLSFDNRFNGACCQVSQYQTQVLEIARDCKQYAGAQQDYIDSLIGDFIDFACPDPIRLKEICLKLGEIPKFKNPLPISLNRAVLNLVIALSEEDEKKAMPKN